MVKIAGTNLATAANKHNIAIPENLSEFSDSSFFVDNSLDIRSINENDLIQKNASSSSTSYALESLEKYPLDTKEQVKKASAYFEKNHKDMDPFTKLEFGVNVVGRAGDLDVPIQSTEVSKYAELDFEVFNKDLYDTIQVRKSYLRDNEEDTKEAYDELLRQSDELGVPKTAEVLYEIDKKAEITGNYGKSFNDPVFSVAGKVGSDGMDIDGTYVRSSSLDAIPSGDLTSIVGNDAIDDLRSDDKLDVLASLPRPVRKEIIDLM